MSTSQESFSEGSILYREGGRALRRVPEPRAAETAASALVVEFAEEFDLVPLIARFNHELALAPELESSWAARPLEWQRTEAGVRMVFEDPGGEVLAAVADGPMEIAAFLGVAIAISTAVGHLHRRGIVHRDLKPSNILVAPERGAAWLMGFGAASRLASEKQAVVPPPVLAGALAYMSPEQTGRMNRSVDVRADLYSLGMIFYELLVGAPPFAASDAMDWMHCHLAREPLDPLRVRGDLPATVVASVLRLLAKNPEERYQTAEGLGADLARCLDDWRTRGEIQAFPLGAHDVSDRLLLAERLYGRDAEYEALDRAIQQIAQGAPSQVVLIFGPPGAGKSSLVNEAHKSVLRAGGTLITGKFDQHRRDIPYSSLAEALRSFVRQILDEGEDAVASWRDRLRGAMGSNGRVVLDLLPELELIVGALPPAPQLPPAEAQARFHGVLRALLGAIARPEHMLALFLDDLQWLDSSTHRLLAELVVQPDIAHLLLIGAYRDQEANASSSFESLLRLFDENPIVRRIGLAPLSPDHVAAFGADTLRCSVERAAPLARALHARTGGNPLFTKQLLGELVERAIVSFDPDLRQWRWDLDRVSSLDGSSDILALVGGRLLRLSAETRVRVATLACLGSRVDASILALASGVDRAALDAALWPAVELGLVLHSSGFYGFSHDAVQQAAYTLLGEVERAREHLRIGRVLSAARSAGAVPEDAIFSIVGQMNGGVRLIDSAAERRFTAGLNLQAASRAKASSAYGSACGYLSQAMELLGDSVWQDDYPLALETWLDRARCEFVAGGLEITMGLLDELLARGRTAVDVAPVYRLKVELHTLRAESELAVASASEGLKRLGIDLPSHPSDAMALAEYEAIWPALDGRPIASLVDLPAMTDVSAKAAMDILSALYAAALFTDLNLVKLYICKMVTLSLRHGNAEASPAGYVWFGSIMGPIFYRYREGYEFGLLALALIERDDQAAHRAKAHFAMELVAVWTQPLEIAIGHLDTTFRVGQENGDLTIACYSRNHLVADLLVRGDALTDVWDQSERGLEFARRARFQDAADAIVSQQRFILAMQGHTDGLGRFDDEGFNEAAFEATLVEGRATTMICFYWILKLQARVLAGDLEAAFVASARAQALLWSAVGHINMLDYHFYDGLLCAAATPTGLGDGPRGHLDRLRAHLATISEWARHGAPVFRDKCELLAAEVARIEGRFVDAADFYERAIQSALDGGFIHNAAMAHERAAGCYLERGLETAGRAHLRAARDSFALWGAFGKVCDLEARHPFLGMQSTAITRGRRNPLVEDFDSLAVIEASQALASELLLPGLLERLLRIALHHAGADRSLLVRHTAGVLHVEAEAQVVGGEVGLIQEPARGSGYPEAFVRHVMETRQIAIVDDTRHASGLVSEADAGAARSMMALPLSNQGQLIAVLYLENRLATHAFTLKRAAILEMIAAQAAISLENTRLYGDIKRREQQFSSLVEANIAGIFMWSIGGRIHSANDAFLDIVGYDRVTLATLTWRDLTPVEWHESDLDVRQALRAGLPLKPEMRELLHRDGHRVPVLFGAASFGEDFTDGIAFVVDLTDRRRAEQAAEDSDRRYREVQGELVHAARIATLGQMTASIAHEVSQPVAATLTFAQAAMRWIEAGVPDEAGAALRQAIANCVRASEVIKRIRALSRNAPLQVETLELNCMVAEVITLVNVELSRNRVRLTSDLAEPSPAVEADRVQLQQVVMNLIVNGIEAMDVVDPMERRLLIRTRSLGTGRAAIVFEDNGPPATAETLAQAFEAFYTTKPGGLGLGLSICRSIVEMHGGTLIIAPNTGRGVAATVSLPSVDAPRRPPSERANTTV